MSQQSSFKPVFWKPGSDRPGAGLSQEKIQTGGDSQSGATVIHNPNVSLSIEQQRQRLPVFKHRNQILYLVENYQTTIIVGM